MKKSLKIIVLFIIGLFCVSNINDQKETTYEKLRKNIWKKINEEVFADFQKDTVIFYGTNYKGRKYEFRSNIYYVFNDPEEAKAIINKEPNSYDFSKVGKSVNGKYIATRSRIETYNERLKKHRVSIITKVYEILELTDTKFKWAIIGTDMKPQLMEGTGFAIFTYDAIPRK